MFLFNPLVLSFLVLIVSFFIVLKNQKPKRKIFGVYSGRDLSYWPKFFFILIVLKLRKWSRKEETSLDELDKAQPLGAHDLAVDAAYFNGSSKDNQILLTNTARRKNKIVNGFVFLRVPEFSDELLVSPKLPQTTLQQTDEEKDSFAAEGIKLSPIIPMKKWSIVYSGKMKKQETGEEVTVNLRAEFKGKSKSFNYDTDMDPRTNADAIAREKWSREYFNKLKDLHQTHYEQYGEIEGVAEINGRSFAIKMPSLRDHSFGVQRNWKIFHRYVMHFLTLENGDRITIGVICIPGSFPSITVGFIWKALEQRNIPVSSTDLQLYQHGEAGTPPTDYAFSFTAGEEKFVVEVEGYLAPEFLIGTDNPTRFVELMAQFTVNGVKGWGAAEWQYNDV